MSTTESMHLTQSVLQTSDSKRLSYYRRSLISDPSEPIRTNCNGCPSCVRIRNINEYSHEATPLLASSISLLRDARCLDKALIALFLFILIFGTGIGIYLLCIESQGAVIEEFDFISRETWGVNTTYLKDIPPLHRPAFKVLLLELITNCTDTSVRCLEYAEFTDNNKEKLKIFNGQVLYNFYQDRQGRVFEGRGWNFQSDCGQQGGCQDVLTIGVLEEHSVAPSSKQIKKLKALLDYSVMDKALVTCYEILVSHTSAKYFDDLASALVEMRKKDGACTYFF